MSSAPKVRMHQCKRCGATNDPESRFCVTCGAPLARDEAPPAENLSAANLAAAPRPSPMPKAPPPSATVRPPDFAYAATAAPPTQEEFEAQRAAAQAAARAVRALAPPAQHPPGTPIASASPNFQLATAVMPGTAQDPETVPEGAPRLLAGFIVTYDSHPHGRFWPIYQGRTRVGRQGSITEVDLEIDHPTASARHAMLFAAACPGRIKIEDTGSTNGTLLNGTRLSPGARHELKDGDRVRFGLLSTIVKIV